MKSRISAAAVLLFFAGVSIRAEIIEQILVKVNGEIFTKSDLEQRQIATLRQKGQQIDLKSDPSNQQLRKALDEITPGIMVDAIDEMLIVQRGKELGYKLAEDQYIKKENKIESEEAFQAALKAENMSLADLRRNVERSMIVQRVQSNEVMGKIGVSEEEARKYYDTHVGEFTTPPTVTLREILIAVPTDTKGINVAASDTARAKIEEIRRRATAGGENFEKMAAEVSEAPSKANAGLIGPISVTELSPELRAAIQTMKAGDVTPVMGGSRGGYQIFKLETITPLQTASFDKAREQISDRVFTDKRKVEYQKYLEKLRAQAIIEWKNADVKRAFDTGLKQQSVGS